CGLVAGGSRLHVVRGGDGDCLEALEGLVRARRAEVRGEVRVVETRAVRPREDPVRALPRPEGHGGIPIGNEPVLVVPGQRTDRPDHGRATRVRITDDTLAASRSPTRVRGLGPRRTGVE